MLFLWNRDRSRGRFRNWLLFQRCLHGSLDVKRLCAVVANSRDLGINRECP
jgi:hypothetical protein